MNKLEKGLATGAAVVAAGAAGHEVFQPVPPSQSLTEMAASDITTDLALGHSLRYLEDGTALVTMKDGTRVQIKSPFLDPAYKSNGDVMGVAVAERTRGSDEGESSAVTTYVEGENGVQNVSYLEKGSDKPVDASKALADSQYVFVERAPGSSGDGIAGGTKGEFGTDSGPGADYFVETKNPQNPNPGAHIAQGTEYGQT